MVSVPSGYAAYKRAYSLAFRRVRPELSTGPRDCYSHLLRYKLTAVVEGDLAIEGATLSKEHDGILYELSAGADGKVTTISVSRAVPADKRVKFKSSMEPAAPESGVAAHVVIGGDRELGEELTWALQKLESSFGHTADGGAVVRNIRWDEPEEAFIAENPDDEALIGIFNVKYNSRPQHRRAVIGADAFARTVVAACTFESLQYAASLFREAEARFRDGQYLDALHYYFLALEDLFANGKTGRAETLAAFRANRLCMKVFADAVKAFEGRHSVHAAVRQMATERRCDWTEDGAVDFVYGMRGMLAHAASRRRRFKEVLARQSDFRPLALFLMHVVNYAILLRKVQITRASEGLPPEPL